MVLQSWSGRSLTLRVGGAVLLLGAWRIGAELVTLGRGHAGHEPAVVYVLCLVGFLCASAGAALLANGTNLFGKAPMGELWTPHLDDAEPHDPCLRRSARPKRSE
jgi:hypothetical protein